MHVTNVRVRSHGRVCLHTLLVMFLHSVTGTRPMPGGWGGWGWAVTTLSCYPISTGVVYKILPIDRVWDIGVLLVVFN